MAVGHLVDTLRAKRQSFSLPPSQNLLSPGHAPLECISFQARTMAAAASRAPSQLSRRDALNLTASAPRLSDLLSKSRSGDTADQQVACVCTPCSAAWSAVAISSCPSVFWDGWCIGIRVYLGVCILGCILGVSWDVSGACLGYM